MTERLPGGHRPRLLAVAAASTLLLSLPGCSPHETSGAGVRVAATSPASAQWNPATTALPTPLGAALTAPAPQPPPPQPPQPQPPPQATEAAATPTSPAPDAGAHAPRLSAAEVRSFAGLHVPSGNGATVSFTFDDGPDPKFTPAVLRLLAANQVPAVFCLIGIHAAGHPDLVAREVADGHLLCDHSRDHDLKMTDKGVPYVRAEVDVGLAQIRSATTAAVPFYRQPGGLWTPDVLAAAADAGLMPLRWSVDPRDWTRPGAVTIAREVLLQLRPGAVVLLHDGGGDRSQTVTALTWLLPALQHAGWRFTQPATHAG